jgi:hypothetical protein
MKYFTLTFLLITLFSIESFTYEISNENEKRDTLDLKYQFYKGDTLFYRIVVWDSIIVDYEQPLLKQRVDLIRITCDSTDHNGLMYLTQEMVESKSKEAFGKDERSKRTSSPWINRKSIVVIDSTGKRHNQFYSDSSRIAINPGGLYFPHLLFDIGSTRKSINESWLVRSTDTLVENSYPPSLLQHTSLFRLAGTIDTLGYESAELTYIRTGQGSFKVETPETFISNRNVINSSGRLRLSRDYHIPIHLFVTIEQKISIFDKQENKTPVWHFIHLDYYLERFIDSPLRPKLEKIEIQIEDQDQDD